MVGECAPCYCFGRNYLLWWSVALRSVMVAEGQVELEPVQWNYNHMNMVWSCSWVSVLLWWHVNVQTNQRSQSKYCTCNLFSDLVWVNLLELETVKPKQLSISMYWFDKWGPEYFEFPPIVSLWVSSCTIRCLHSSVVWTFSGPMMPTAALQRCWMDGYSSVQSSSWSEHVAHIEDSS